MAVRLKILLGRKHDSGHEHLFLPLTLKLQASIDSPALSKTLTCKQRYKPLNSHSMNMYMYITKYTLQDTFFKTTNSYCFNHYALTFKVQVELKLNCSLTFISMPGKKFGDNHPFKTLYLLIKIHLVSSMTYIQVELLQRPAVGLGHVLSGGGDVRLRNKQASQPYIEILQTENKIYM